MLRVSPMSGEDNALSPMLDDLSRLLLQALLLGAVGACTYALSTWAARARTWAWSCLYVSVSVSSPDELYVWLTKRIIEHTRCQPSKLRRKHVDVAEPDPNTTDDAKANQQAIASIHSFRAATKRSLERENERYSYGMEDTDHEERFRVLYMPGDGMHKFFFRGAGITASLGTKDTKRRHDKRTLTLSAYRWHRDELLAFVDSAIEGAKSSSDGAISLYRGPASSWNPSFGLFREVPKLKLCAPGLPILPTDTLESVVSDAGLFLSSEAFYERIGVPWRRGYLFHGLPGTGKTSLVRRLAAEFELNVCILALTDQINDSTLMNLFSSTPPRSLILIEDIDVAFPRRDKKQKKKDGDKDADKDDDDKDADDDASTDTTDTTTDKKGKVNFSMSSLFNAIDGIAGQTGSILVMTTNHPEQLDPALIRSGRIDRRVAFGPVEADQAERAFLRFFPGEDTLARVFADNVAAVNDMDKDDRTTRDGRPLVMADVQEMLMRFRDDAQGAAHESTKTLVATDACA